MYMARKIKELLVLILRGISPEKPSNKHSSKHSMPISKSKYYHLHALDKQQNIIHIQIIFSRARNTASSLCTYTHIRTAYLYYDIGKYLYIDFRMF